MAQPTQELPDWLSASTSFITTRGAVIPTTVIVNLPLTYYGPSIPLGTGWVYGGRTTPLPSRTRTRSNTRTLTPNPTASATSLLSETDSSAPSTSLSISPSIIVSATGLSSVSLSASFRTSTATQTFTPSPTLTPSSIDSTSLSISPSSSNSLPSTAVSDLSTITPLPSTSSITLPSSFTLPPSVSLTPSPFPFISSSTSQTTTLLPSTGLQADTASNSGLSTAAKIAISVLASVLGLFIIGCCCILLFLISRRRRKRPNFGRPLEGDVSGLPRMDHEQSALLAGRLSGGGSPEPPHSGTREMHDLSHLPIAHRYIHGSGIETEGRGRGVYQAVGLQRKNTSASGSGSQSSNGGHGEGQSLVSDELDDDAELMTAERATRSPFARLTRLSWLTGLRRSGNMSGIPEDEDDGGWVNVQAPRNKRQGMIGPPPRMTLDEPPRLTSPPPTSYLNPTRPEISKHISNTSMQSGRTVFYDAEESRSNSPLPQIPPLSPLTPPPVPAIVTQRPESGSTISGGPTSADFPPPPSMSFTWPRFSSPTTATDELDSPIPAPYARTSATSSGGAMQLPNPWAALGVAREMEKRRSAPDLRDRLPTLSEDPPRPIEGWRRRIDTDDPAMRRLTLGPTSLIPSVQKGVGSDVVSMQASQNTYTGTGTSSYPSTRPTQSSYGAVAGHRMPSLSAIGGNAEMGVLNRPPPVVVRSHEEGMGIEDESQLSPPPPRSTFGQGTTLSPQPAYDGQTKPWWKMS